MIVIAHYDGHGVATGAAIARVTGSKLVTKFPDTGPRTLAKFIRENFGELAEEDRVVIVDIPVDVVNPEDYINAVNALAKHTDVRIHDHHGTDAKYLTRINAHIDLYHDATTMAMEIAKTYGVDPEDVELLMVGVVADRDPGILRVFPRRFVEEKLMPLANTLDILVRKNTEETASRLVEEGVLYLRRMANEVEYPPVKLVEKLKIAEHRGHVVLTDFADAGNNKELTSWLPKTAEALLMKAKADYAVIPGTWYDYREKKVKYSVRVIQYWLSQLPLPEQLLSDIIGARKVVGHEKYVSILTKDAEETTELAYLITNRIVAALQGRSMRVRST